MDSSELLQALKALRAQFTTLKSTSTREKTRLQQQLDLAREQNRSLAAEVRELTQEVQALKRRLAEQASRNDELDIVRELQAEFDGYQRTWEFEEAKQQIKDEEEHLRVLELEMSRRDSDYKSQRVTARRTPAISSLIEQPVLNQDEETPEPPPLDDALTLRVYCMARRPGFFSHSLPRDPGVIISKYATIQTLFDRVEKNQPNLSGYPRRYWRVKKSAIEINSANVQNLYYPVSRMKSDEAVVFGKSEQDRKLALWKGTWGEGDAIVIETRNGTQWPSEAE